MFIKNARRRQVVFSAACLHTDRMDRGRYVHWPPVRFLKTNSAWKGSSVYFLLFVLLIFFTYGSLCILAILSKTIHKIEILFVGY